MKSIKKITLLAMFAVPLDKSTGWEELHFNSIPKNTIHYSSEGMTVSVKQSASPLLYPLKKPTLFKKVRAKGKILGTLNLKKNIAQGLKTNDDFGFRLGLVLEGKETLSWMKRQIAADWVKKMFAMAPKGSGVDHILFYEVAQSPGSDSKVRDHYFSKYLKEKVVTYVKENGEFEFEAEIPAKKVLGLWISIDGDDTKSSYSTVIETIELLDE